MPYKLFTFSELQQQTKDQLPGVLMSKDTKCDSTEVLKPGNNNMAKCLEIVITVRDLENRDNAIGKILVSQDS